MKLLKLILALTLLLLPDVKNKIIEVSSLSTDEDWIHYKAQNGINGLKSQRQMARAAYNASPKWTLKEPLEAKNIMIPQEILDKDVVWGQENIGDGSIIILSKRSLLELLFQGKIIYCDGTFKIVPRLFYSANVKGQVLIMSRIVGGASITCAQVLIPGKSVTIYVRALQMMKELSQTLLGQEPKWEKAMVDFELALGNALTAQFPRLVLLGCLFHYCQAVMRYSFCKCGLKGLYFRSEAHKLIIRSFLALPYLPADKIVGAREAVLQRLSIRYPNEMQHTGLRRLVFHFTSLRVTLLHKKQNISLPT